MTLHVCPVCGKEHIVTAARQSVAWGRRLTCSCACELERRRRVRMQLQNGYAQRVMDSPYSHDAHPRLKQVA
jgi:hypothetical protein